MADSLLYPRLPPAVATALFEICRSEPLESVRAQARASHPEAVFASLGGIEVTEGHLTDLAERIRGAADGSGFPEELRNVKIFHYLRNHQFVDRYHIFASEQQYSGFLTAPLAGANAVFQRKVRELIGAEYPFMTQSTAR